ncbi:uncharacterized protein LY79DRAFT_570250 [Colletotrichum navitas]|uniref:Uncharacterized protein n=1 Tax=Colletotrichum navitas TaxID=681940 RepID=A0AAD8PM04_9PEZI|nr:uncharacterized protein LY79DRAFT_570250 [Colletotrichum navitas]KAK1570161.1 hypothetical protein LY79DRAFT_570250 [Colletotrichum navitas]
MCYNISRNCAVAIMDPCSRLRPWNHCQRHFVNFCKVPEYVRCCCCFWGCSNSVENERLKAKILALQVPCRCVSV